MYTNGSGELTNWNVWTLNRWRPLLSSLWWYCTVGSWGQLQRDQRDTMMNPGIYFLPLSFYGELRVQYTAKSANSKASERLWILRSKIKPIMMSLVLWKARDKQKVMSGKPYPFRIRLYCMVLFGFGSGVAWHRWACTAKRRSSESTLSWRNTLSLTFTPIGKLWSP